jgi:uncharacterized protein YfaT (DUF1175 family)
VHIALSVFRRTTALWIVMATAAAAVVIHAGTPPVDDTDRAAFQSWFTFLADTQFERRTADVTDCASLVRHAYREALRAHTPAWYRANALPLMASFPDVRHPPPVENGAWLLFRVAIHPDRFAEFADATALVRYNTRLVGRDAARAQPGDLLYFRQENADSPAHLMVVVGDSRFDPSRHDWLVYHTGPDGDSPGEVRKVALADLERHPSPRWRPVRANPAFIGVMRLAILDRER